MSTKKINWLSLLMIFLLSTTFLEAQTESSEEIQKAENEEVSLKEKNATYRIEAFGTYSSEDRTPFWIQNKTQGIVPFLKNSLFFKGGVFYDQTISKDVSYNGGLDLVEVVNDHETNHFWLQQAYGELRWKAGAISIGSREQFRSEITDPSLSSGDLVYSNNIRPNPEIRIYLPEFRPIPYTHNKLYVKASFAVGKYLDGKYIKDIGFNSNQSFVENPNSHSKSIFLRLGNIEWEKHGFQCTIGVNDYAQWGGECYVFKYNKKTEEWALTNPESASKNFLRVLLPLDDYKSGAHMASYNLKVDYGRKYADEVYSFYFQHMFNVVDDLFLRNYKDGMIGLRYKSIRKKRISGLVLEYIYTKYQGGKNVAHHSNYYNQTSIYQGYSYYGRGIGNPLLMSPEANPNNILSFMSNRVQAVHFGLEGYINSDFKYKFLATYANSDGTYAQPYTKEKKGVTSCLEIHYDYPKIKGLSIEGSLAAEKGAFFVKEKTENFGASLSIRKTGKIF